MGRLESMLERLPGKQRREVEAYVERVLLEAEAPLALPAADARPNNIQFDRLQGMLLPEDEAISDDELKRRSLDAWADAAED